MSYEIMSIAATVTQYIGPPIIVLGIITNSLNIVILRQQALKDHSCSLYFVVLSTSNLAYTCIATTVNLLLDGYGINLTQHSNIFCKFISYFINFCSHLSAFMLVLASIDRYCASSSNVHRRNLSSYRTARWVVFGILLFLSLLMLPNAIVFNAYDDDAVGCASNAASLFNQIYLIINVTIYVLITPLLMILFGFLTIYNTQQPIRHRVVVIHRRPNEKQLVRMLLVQVSSHLVLNLPFCIVYFMLILPIEFRSTVMFYFLYVIFKIPFQINFITPFFLYILSAKVYRTELIRLMKQILRIRNGRTVHPINRTLQTDQHQSTL